MNKGWNVVFADVVVNVAECELFQCEELWSAECELPEGGGEREAVRAHQIATAVCASPVVINGERLDTASFHEDPFPSGSEVA